jgi:hypothetical protein
VGWVGACSCRLTRATDLHETWEPSSAVVGSLEDREEVEILQMVSGSNHFPTQPGKLDLRMMARTTRGWFEARSSSGATFIRAIPPPSDGAAAPAPESSPEAAPDQPDPAASAEVDVEHKGLSRGTRVRIPNHGEGFYVSFTRKRIGKNTHRVRFGDEELDIKWTDECSVIRPQMDPFR